MIELIHTNQLQLLDSLVNEDNVNLHVGSTQEPLLFIAIQENNLDAVKLLIKNGASIEQLYNDLNSLMYCVIKDKLEIGAYLIGIGANVNSFNSRKNNALIYAARFGRLSFVRLLLDSGANTDTKNITGLSALDYAEKFSEIKVSEILRLAIEDKYIPYKSSFKDGPHLFKSSNNSGSVDYLTFDSTAQNFSRVSNSIKFHGGVATIHVNDFLGDLPVFINQSRDFKSHLKHYSKIFAVGDLHGDYDSLCVLLQNSGVIDSHSNWTFGDGIVLFVGDIFDRGNKVTESLWLIYKLQNQAEDSYGSVLWVLGNHDLMALDGDVRYLNNNYLLLSSKNKVEYKDLFGSASVLGDWIRQQPSVIRIGDILFSHAGISPSLLENKIEFRKINLLIKKYLNHQLEQDEVGIVQFLLGESGPFWYRGYMMETSFSKRLTLANVQNINQILGVKVQVFGHTEVDHIVPTYNGNAIPINVSFSSPRYTMEALYIEGDKFYRVIRSGERVYLFSLPK